MTSPERITRRAEEENTLSRRVAKLLALASNNSNRAEAEAALLKVQELVADDPPTLVNEDEVPRTVPVSMTCPSWLVELSGVVALNCRTAASVENYGLALTGFGEDPDIAAQWFAAARREALLRVGVWRADHPDATVDEQDAYLWGFVQGLHAALKEQAERQGSALLLTVDPRITAHFVAMGCYQQPTPAPPSRHNHVAAVGEQAGKQYYQERGRGNDR